MNLPSTKYDQKKYEKSNVTIALSVFYAKKKNHILLILNRKNNLSF